MLTWCRLWVGGRQAGVVRETVWALSWLFIANFMNFCQAGHSCLEVTLKWHVMANEDVCTGPYHQFRYRTLPLKQGCKWVTQDSKQIACTDHHTLPFTTQRSGFRSRNKPLRCATRPTAPTLARIAVNQEFGGSDKLPFLAQPTNSWLLSGTAGLRQRQIAVPKLA